MLVEHSATQVSDPSLTEHQRAVSRIGARFHAKRPRWARSNSRDAQRDHARLLLLVFERSDEEWNWTEAGAWRRRYGRRLADLRRRWTGASAPAPNPLSAP